MGSPVKATAQIFVAVLVPELHLRRGDLHLKAVRPIHQACSAFSLAAAQQTVSDTQRRHWACFHELMGQPHLCRSRPPLQNWAFCQRFYHRGRSWKSSLSKLSVDGFRRRLIAASSASRPSTRRSVVFSSIREQSSWQWGGRQELSLDEADQPAPTLPVGISPTSMPSGSVVGSISTISRGLLNITAAAP